MPRYHFNVVNDAPLPDREGIELADLRAARIEAVQFSAQSLSELAETFWDTGEWKLNVTDGDGLILFHLHIAGMQAPATQWERPGPVLKA